jgi:antitoxin YefM
MNLTISYSDIRKNLKSYFDKACDEHTPLLVTRKNGENVVVISEDDYRSMEETAYLSKSPKNLERLLKAMNRKESYTLQQVKDELGI